MGIATSDLVRHPDKQFIEPAGCFRYSGPGAWPGNPVADILLMPYTFIKTLDCDCMVLKTCTPGEPPIPFHWSPPNNTLIGGTGEINPGSNTANQVGTVRKMRRKRAVPTQEEPLDFEYAAAVLKAYNALSYAVATNIREGWNNTLTPFINDYDVFLDGSHRLDPSPSLAILLSNPGNLAGNAVMAMLRRDANLLLYCTRVAFDHLETQSFPKSLEDQKNQVPRKDREPYIDALKRLFTLWKNHVPKGLSNQLVPHETYTYTTISDMGRGKRVMQRTNAEDVCQSIWDKGVREVGRDESYVAEVEESFKVINALLEALPNSYAKGMNVHENWPAIQKMDWSSEELMEVFREQKPEVQIALSYLALTLWTGRMDYGA